MGGSAVRSLSRNEIAYLGARGALAASFLTVFVAGETRMLDPSSARLVVLATLLSSATSVGVLVCTVWLRVSPRTVLKAAAIPDSIGMVAAIMGSQEVGDPAFVWVLGFAIVNALLLPRAESGALSVGAGALYLGAYSWWTLGATGPFPWPTQVIKALGVIALGYVTGWAVDEHAAREAELESRQRAIESLNTELESRVADLRAIAEISDTMHSSLDFDEVGDRVLRVIEKAIGIAGCGILIIDARSGDTIISVGGSASGPGGDGARRSGDDDPCAYLTLVENERLIVLFGVPEADIARMRSEDRFLLQAIATDLSVAAENSRLYKLTKQLSLTDELTELHNYRYLQQRLHDEIERAARHGHDLSLLMLDVDDFKGFNDRYGHLAGDHALADIALVLRECVRDVDVPCRFGGEEFSVVLTETDIRGATVAAEKIRAAIEAHRFVNDVGERVVPLTVSIGASSYPAWCSDEESLLRTADDQLYRAKNTGRNRVSAP